MTIPDLKPSSQDTSAFYLGKIYEVLADPNVTSSSIPSSVANPPPFSPPRPAIWVNILFILSLVISLSCALLATLWQRWARRYLYLAQHATPHPEDRARIRAFFRNGVETMHISLAVEGLPTLIHLSLFLFFGGLVLYLFNVNKEVSAYVVACIGFFVTVYGLVTLLPLIRHDSPYNTPLSAPVWYLNTWIQYVTVTALAFITGYCVPRTSMHFVNLRERCRRRIWRGMGWATWRNAKEPSLESDLQIFGRTINTIVNDDSLEKFFETIPGFFKSRQDSGLEKGFPEGLFKAFWDMLDEFMGRTSSSNSVTESAKSHRVNICKDIMKLLPCPENFILRSYFDQVPATFEWMWAIERWFPNRSRKVSYAAQAVFAKNIAKISKDKDLQVWGPLASEAYGFPLSKVAINRNDAILALLTHVCRQVNDPDELGLVKAFTEFDIRDTLPGLQNQFCSLWNKLLEEATPHGTSTHILRLIRHLYMDLHQGTDSALSAIDSNHRLWPSYRSCNVASHFPSFTPVIAVFVPSSDSLTAPIIPVVMSETPHESLLPTPALASGSMTIAPVSPVNPSTPQERVPSPESLPLGTPVNPLGPGMSIQVPQDTSPTHHAPSKSAVPSVIKFNRHGDFLGLLPYSPHGVVYEDKRYPTVLHLFEARKFLPHRPDLAESVRLCERVDRVASISAEHVNFVRPDWVSVMMNTVSKFSLQLVPRVFFLTD